MEVGGQRHAPAALPPGKRTGTRCIGGWVGTRGTENLAPTGIRSPDRPARNESLYRLRYPGHQINTLISGKLRYPAAPFPPRRCRIKQFFAVLVHRFIRDRREVTVHPDNTHLRLSTSLKSTAQHAE
jgi:hypothetical protein